MQTYPVLQAHLSKIALILLAIATTCAPAWSQNNGDETSSQLLREASAHFKGTGRPVDLKKAFDLVKNGAEEGDLECAARLGYLYMTGQGTAKDDVAALRWLRIAADGGLAKAQFNLAALLQNGQAGSSSPSEARHWFEKAAEQNIDRAQVLVGEASYFGKDGVEPDYASALKWFKRAAATGNAIAQNFTGVMLQTGQGTPRDGSAAIAMFRLAADQNLAKAQANLGLALINGAEVPKDDVEGLKWLQLSADQGEITAIRALAELKEGLPEDVKNKADKLVREHREKRGNP